MKKISFFNWEIEIDESLFTIVDKEERKMAIMENSFELNAVIWMNSNDEIQVKPTWDCVFSVNEKKRIISIRHADYLREN
ncbi:hypothetical protein ACQKFO_18770 [Rossellomorea sp. NPDC071047]|uniref:hypothetical protein n=1 Tax=Rossellomorea sp. NPDC071047 TaxID=3390675 RepID=UPI003D088221